MKFPYGVSDFYKLITEEYLYIDRTACLPVLEQAGDALLFLRLRRFGKSLLISMLENYYDVNKADQFERLFGHLAIGREPTPLHNSYMFTTLLRHSLFWSIFNVLVPTRVASSTAI